MLIVVLEGSGNKLKKNPQNENNNINKEDGNIKKGFLKKYGIQ